MFDDGEYMKDGEVGSFDEVVLTLLRLALDDRFLLMRFESRLEGDEVGLGLLFPPGVETPLSDDGVVDLCILNPPLLEGLLVLLLSMLLFCDEAGD